MRSSKALLLAAGMVTVAVPGALAAIRYQPNQEITSTATVEDRYGAVYYDLKTRRWAILSNATHRGRGLSAVSCSSQTGILTVAFTPLAAVGTYTVDEDDAYAGRYAAGAVAGTRSLAITFRKVGSGSLVPCGSAALRIVDSSLQVWIRGTIASSSAAPAPSSVPPVIVEPSSPPEVEPPPPTPPSLPSSSRPPVNGSVPPSIVSPEPVDEDEPPGTFG
ncbi:hypothetical protein AB0M36_07860 [Actinoplanes sp. NPDC051346]|uniref:hypothetical protein n=1 Tax=Actinoplanes sp. NPDC051346 TaxID=3155048 RepID=UPI0034167E68